MKLKRTLTVGFLLAAIVAIIPVSSQSSNKDEPKKIVLSADNTVVLNDEITGESVGAVISKAKELNQAHGLRRLHPSKAPIYLYLRTPGGDVQAGFEMMDALKGLDRPVETVTNFAASMGFQTVQGLSKRHIVKHGVLMSHHATGGAQGELGGSKPNQLGNRLSFWEERLNEMDAETVARTNGKQTMASYQLAYDHELWVTGDKAVAQGYADDVVTVSCDESLSGTTEHHLNFMGIDISYELDNCPLNSAPMNIKVNIPTNKGTKSLEAFLSEGGEFGTSCLVASGLNTKKLCASDTTLTLEGINGFKSDLKSRYINIQNHVIPYRF